MSNEITIKEAKREYYIMYETHIVYKKEKILFIFRELYIIKLTQTPIFSAQPKSVTYKFETKNMNKCF